MEGYMEGKPTSATVTVRINKKLKTRLEKLAGATGRTRSWLVADAINSYVDIQEWQVGETKKGLKEADEGDFAEDGDVKKILKKWGVNAR
jgi:predicted transcriptional regulator